MATTLLETERLILREFIPEDLQLIFSLDSDRRVMEFIRPPSKTIEEANATYNKIMTTRSKHPLFGNWVAVLRESHEPIGWFCLKDLDNTAEIEVGYRLLHAFWGNGYATEGAKALITYGFTTCNLSAIVGVTSLTNIRSQHVLEKCGLKFSKTAFIYETDVKYYIIKNS